MFPGAGAQVYRNEEGEVMGWDYPSDNPSDFYCGDCGYSHRSTMCPMDYDLEEDDE